MSLRVDIVDRDPGPSAETAISMRARRNAARAPADGFSGAKGSATRVMVVEPESRRRNQLMSAICAESSLLLADSVATGRHGFERLERVRPEVLLAGTTLANPQIAEFVRTVRETLASCEVLTIVSEGYEDAALESLAAGAGGCVPDACTGAELAALIQQARAGICPMAPAVTRRLLERLRGAWNMESKPAPAGTQLTQREADVLGQLARGCTYADAAVRLGVSLHTVAAHLRNAYRKLDVHSASAAVMRAIELRIIAGG